jgi:PII-like signaling protein
MLAFKPAKLLRILCSEHDQHKGTPLYQAVVNKCLEMKIAGVTVLQGSEGYGESAEIHRSRLIRQDLPIVITIVDSAEQVTRLIPILEDMIDTGLIAISDVDACRIEKAAQGPPA